ncbi:hypothetical protein [Pseudoduganella umbonata]|uniref:hypothetical protein n=1 Tax=Pseudoduganella umbonata TaxID=864828 RepID=UPI0015865513|nr:hypothetical protein [Pseudoduganella umbonata]
MTILAPDNLGHRCDGICHYFQWELPRLAFFGMEIGQTGLARGLLYINHPNPFRFLPEGATP